MQVFIPQFFKLHCRTMNSSSFRHQILLLVGFLDLLAVSMIITQFQTYVHGMGVSPFINGCISSIYGAVQLASSPLVGNWSDIQGRKLILQICLLVTAASYFLLGSSNILLFIFLARILSGVFKHSQMLCRAYLADNSSESEKAHILGYFNSASSFGFIIGPTIGGHLAETSNGFFWICVISSIVFLVSFCVVSLLVPPGNKQEKVTEKEIHSFPLFHHACWSKHWDILTIRFFLSFSTLMYRSNLALVLMEDLHLTSIVIGYVISFQAIISSFSSFFVGYVASCYKNNTRLLMHASVLQVAALVGLTNASNIWLLLFFFIPLCFSNAVSRVCITSITVDRCDKSELGTMVGIGQSIVSVARMLSPLTAGMMQQISLHGPGVAGIVSSVVGSSVLIFDMYISEQSHVKIE